MIGALQGTVFHTGLDHVILMVSGVGYKISVPFPLLSKAKQGDELTVWIYDHIRQDAFDLYGFETQQELRLFELVISVSGIGPKTALGIMGKGAIAVEQAIHRADVAFFTGIPRLGSKNAQKLIIELKNKIGGKELDLTAGSEEQQEVIKALQTLGFERREIMKQLTTLDVKLPIEEQIKQTLKLLGKK